jgi:hypothetical protein
LLKRLKKPSLELRLISLPWFLLPFQTIPIPGESVTLNGADLRAQSKEEKDSLKEELLKILEDTDYAILAEKRTAMADNANKTLAAIPNMIFVG